VSFIKNIINAVKMGTNEILLSRYDRWTMATYLRKQGAQIGNNCSIMVHSLGTEPYLIKIGNHVAISKGVVFATHEAAARIIQDEIPGLHVFGPIIIEDNCVIGQNAFLCPNIRIGRNSIIGANSVVISDIPADKVAMGVPARVMGSTEKLKEKYRALWKQQEPPGTMTEQGKDFFHSKYYKKNRKILKEHLLKLYAERLSLENNNNGEKDLQRESDEH
jgi:acetyltransferase-like isoleucine patch superfamily enzyme